MSLGNIRTKIPDYTTCSDSEGNFTLFRIEASTAYSTWNVSKRYRSFADLHKALTQRFPNTKLPQLPKKKVIGSSLSSFVKDRRTSLEAYLTQLVMIPEVVACPVMLEFLEASQSFSGLESHMHRLADQVERLHQYCGELQYQLTVATHNIAAQDASIKELRGLVQGRLGDPSAGVGGATSDSSLLRPLPMMVPPAGTAVQSIFGGGGIDKAATLPMPDTSSGLLGLGGVDDDHHAHRLLSDGTLLNSLALGEPPGFLKKSHSMGGLAAMGLPDDTGTRSLSTNAPSQSRFEEVFSQRDSSVDSRDDDYGYYGRESSRDASTTSATFGIAGLAEGIGDLGMSSETVGGIATTVATLSPNSTDGLSAIFNDLDAGMVNVEIPSASALYSDLNNNNERAVLDANGSGSLTRVFSPSASLWNTNTPMRNMNHSLMSAMWGDGDAAVGTTAALKARGTAGGPGRLLLNSRSTRRAPMLADTCKKLLNSKVMPAVMSTLFEEVANSSESRAQSGDTDHADLDARTLSGGLSSASRCMTWCQSFDDVLDLLLPQKAQVQYRNDVCTFLGKHVQRSALTQVFEHNMRSRCFLPHDPILISLMLWKNQEAGGWYVRLNERLCRVAGGIMGAEETTNFHTEGEACQPHTLTNVSFGSVSAISNAFKVQCIVDNALNVQIRANVRKDLCFHLFIEEFDRCIDNLSSSASSSPVGGNSTNDSFGAEASLLAASSSSAEVGPGESVDVTDRPNIFKKALLLIRAWWCYEVSTYQDSGDGAAGAGVGNGVRTMSNASYLISFLPDSALCVMVCAIFTKYRELIAHPFHALVLFLSEFAGLDFASNVVTVNGIVPLATWNEQLIAAEKEEALQVAAEAAAASAATSDSGHSMADLAGLVLPSAIHELYVENTRTIIPSESFQRIRDLAEGSETEPETLMPMVKPSDGVAGVGGLESSLNFVNAGVILPIAPHSITIVHPLYTKKYNIMTEPGNTPVLVTKFSQVLKHAAAHLNECLLGKNGLNIENVELNEAFSQHHTSFGAFFFKSVVGKFGQTKNSKSDLFEHERQLDRSNTGDGVGAGTVCSGYGFSNNIVPVLPVANPNKTAEAGSEPAAVDGDGTAATAEGMDPAPPPVVYTVGPNEVSQQRYDRVGYCKLLVDGTIADGALRLLVTTILRERVGNPLPVGEIGKLIQEATVANNITTIVKEKYGGLKKFMEMFKDDFVLSKDHPYNPHVFLKDAPPPPHALVGGAIGGNQSKHKGGGGGGGNSGSKTDMRKRRSFGPNDFINQYNNAGRITTGNHPYHMQAMQNGNGGAQVSGSTQGKGLPRNNSFNTPDKATNAGARPGPGFVMRGNVHSGSGGSASKAHTTPPSSDKQRNQHHSVDGGSMYHSQRRFASGSPTPYQGNGNVASSSAYGMVGMPDPTAPSFVPGGSMGKKNNK